MYFYKGGLSNEKLYGGGDLLLFIQSMMLTITTKVVSLIPAHGQVYWILVHLFM